MQMVLANEIQELLKVVKALFVDPIEKKLGHLPLLEEYNQLSEIRCLLAGLSETFLEKELFGDGLPEIKEFFLSLQNPPLGVKVGEVDVEQLAPLHGVCQ